jgi:uncharacterized membrane protein YgaE (UPF0421/DUF939 family)
LGEASYLVKFHVHGQKLLISSDFSYDVVHIMLDIFTMISSTTKAFIVGAAFGLVLSFVFIPVPNPISGQQHSDTFAHKKAPQKYHDTTSNIELDEHTED